MSSTLQNNNDVIPPEYRELTQEFINATGSASDGSTIAASMGRFADQLGIGSDYRSVMESEDGVQSLNHLLGHFRNNVELLIHKTWVEKADESHKEKLLDRIPLFVSDMEKSDYVQAHRTFIHILDELAYLLFGSQSRKSDFIEYSFRIDPQIGLFWWYGGALSSLLGRESAEQLKAVLLVGICFLTDF